MVPSFVARSPIQATKAAPTPTIFIKDSFVQMSNQMIAKIIGVFQHQNLPEVPTMGTQLLVVTKAYPKAVFITLSDVFNKLSMTPEGAEFSNEELMSKLSLFQQEHVGAEQSADGGSTVLVIRKTPQLSWNVVCYCACFASLAQALGECWLVAAAGGSTSAGTRGCPFAGGKAIAG